MSLLDAPDRHSQVIRFILIVLGAFLAIVAWLRWARGTFFALALALAPTVAASSGIEAAGHRQPAFQAASGVKSPPGATGGGRTRSEPARGVVASGGRGAG